MCFKDKALKIFKIFTDQHVKTCRSLKLRIPINEFRRIYTLSVDFKLKPLKKALSSVKTKANPNFSVKLAERSHNSFLLSI